MDEFIHFFWIEIQISNPVALVNICITNYNLSLFVDKDGKE